MNKFIKSGISDKFWLLIILAVGFWIRLVGLGQSLWLDEAIEWWAVTSFDLKQLLFGYMAGDFRFEQIILHYNGSIILKTLLVKWHDGLKGWLNMTMKSFTALEENIQLWMPYPDIQK